MRVLPREHGATVIWLSSLIIALATLDEAPSVIGLAAFVTASVAALVLLAKLTGGSAAVMRIERNIVLLPILSGLLTLIVPLGHVLMLGQLSKSILAVWFLFLTYTVAGVVYTRIAVRAVLGRTKSSLATCMIPVSFILVAEVAVLSAIGWLHSAAAIIVGPSLFWWLAITSLSESEASSRTGIVRRVGIMQSANMIAVSIILAVVSRL